MEIYLNAWFNLNSKLYKGNRSELIIAAMYEPP